MIISTLLLGILGVILYLYLFITVQSHLRAQRGALIHLILSIVCILWLPIPITIFMISGYNESLIIGAIFGVTSLLLEMIVMAVQASHLSYALSELEKDTNYDKINDWVLNGLIGSQVELLMGVLKFLWVLFVTTYFVTKGVWIMTLICLIFVIVDVIYIPSLILDNLKIKSKIKVNQMMIHLDMILWYTFMLIIIGTNL